jgi:hypothetical protein
MDLHMFSHRAVAEIAGADFGDKRLDARVAILLSTLGDRPILSIPAACGGRAEMKAAQSVKRILFGYPS